MPVGFGRAFILTVQFPKDPNLDLVGHDLDVVGGICKAKGHGVPVAHLDLLNIGFEASILTDCASGFSGICGTTAITFS
jgi:hypothetical protein